MGWDRWGQGIIFKAAIILLLPKYNLNNNNFQTLWMNILSISHLKTVRKQQAQLFCREVLPLHQWKTIDLTLETESTVTLMINNSMLEGKSKWLTIQRRKSHELPKIQSIQIRLSIWNSGVNRAPRTADRIVRGKDSQILMHLEKVPQWFLTSNILCRGAHQEILKMLRKLSVNQEV